MNESTEEKLRQLHDVTREMMAVNTKSELFDIVTASASGLLGFKYNTVRRHDETQGHLVPVAVSPTLQEKTGPRRVYSRNSTVQWHAIDKNKILAFQNVSEISDQVNRPGGGSMLVVPLTGFGVLTMGTPDPQSIGENDVELARVFRANIETALIRISQREKLNEHESELTRRGQQISVLNRALRHNVRNKLMVIMGSLTELDEQLRDARSAHIEQSLQAAREIESVANKARQVQEIASTDCAVTRHDLTTVVESQIQRAQKEYSAVSFEPAYPDSAPALAVNRVDEAIWEAIENAIIHNDSTQPRVAVSLCQVDDQQQLTVADNGPGIPEQERKVINKGIEHDLFHTSGLGLWYMKWLIDESGGSFELSESRFDTGTAVRFRFPLSITKNY